MRRKARENISKQVGKGRYKEAEGRKSQGEKKRREERGKKKGEEDMCERGSRGEC